VVNSDLQGFLNGRRCREQVAGVTQAHACCGQPDIFAYIEDDDDRAMADTVLVTIHGIPGVRATETHLVAPV
jgi:hypothetical protein